MSFGATCCHRRGWLDLNLVKHPEVTQVQTLDTFSLLPHSNGIGTVASQPLRMAEGS